MTSALERRAEGKQGVPPGVVEAGDAEGDGEEVEERVVPREGNRGHERDDEQRGVVAEGAGGEEEERDQELDHEHTRTRGALPPERELMRMPGQWRWQRLGFVMKGERSEIAPRVVAAGEFHDAGEEHEPEEQPPDQPA